MTIKDKWEKEFDEKFCRVDKSPDKRGYMDKWFVRDTITGKEIKQFIKNLLQEEKKELKEALEDMTYQFAYEGKKNGKDVIHTGGLSALENAFSVLEWKDPKALKEIKEKINTK